MEQETVILKQCSKCGIEKELNDKNFGKHSYRKDGYDSQCKVCKKLFDQERYKKKRQEILVQKKLYYQKNREQLLAKQHAYIQQKRIKVGK